MTDSGSPENATVAKGQRGPDFVVPEHGPRLIDPRPPTFTRPTVASAGPVFPRDGVPASGDAPPAGSPPSSGAPPRSSPRSGPSRVLVALLAVAAAVVVVAGVGIGVVIMNPATLPVRAPMPEDTARAFVEAAYRSDCPAVRATITDEFWDGAGLTCLDVSFHGVDFADTTVADWTFTDTEITGNEASLTLDPPGEIPSTALRMRLVDGTWKITNWQF
ncbi:hypothetical protein [Microlunatus speluncae]|uniref:hypothetical protein n=1 Tax=Microlunatus speluncae TaxID=2594267 RepID=UPI0012662B18|nr:hypothetical protein [Microlunatus speluncae]